MLAARGHGRIDWARSLALRGNSLGGAVDGLFLRLVAEALRGWKWVCGGGGWVREAGAS